MEWLILPTWLLVCISATLGAMREYRANMLVRLEVMWLITMWSAFLQPLLLLISTSVLVWSVISIMVLQTVAVVCTTFQIQPVASFCRKPILPKSKDIKRF